MLPQNISSTRKQEGKSAQVLIESLCTLLTTTRCSLMKDEPVKIPGMLTQLQNLAAKFNKLQSSLVDQALIIITQSRKWNYVMLKDFDTQILTHLQAVSESFRWVVSVFVDAAETINPPLETFKAQTANRPRGGTGISREEL